MHEICPRCGWDAGDQHQCPRKSDRIVRIRQRLSLGYYREGERALASTDISHLLRRIDELTEHRDQARRSLAEAWEAGRRAGYDAGSRWAFTGDEKDTPNPYLGKGERL